MFVTLTKLGTLASAPSEIKIPYNGEEFEFLSEFWRGLARRAACQADGLLREGDCVAHVHFFE